MLHLKTLAKGGAVLAGIVLLGGTASAATLGDLLSDRGVWDRVPDEARQNLEGLEVGAGNQQVGTEDQQIDGEPDEDIALQQLESDTGHEACFAATEHARSILAGLLDGSFFEQLNLPEQANAGLSPEGQEGVAASLEAVENCGMGSEELEALGGPPEGTSQGPPEGTPQGRPEGTPQGPPAGVPPGPPAGAP